MKLRKILPVIFVCLLFTGCWDKVEIDRRNFISTIAIGPGKEISKQKELKNVNPKDPFPERQIKKLNITYAFPDISQLGPEKGGTAETKSIPVEAYSMQDGITQASAKTSRVLNLSHTRLLILSSDIMGHQEVMKEIVDYLQRSPDLNRMMYVLIAEGNVEQYVNFKPNMEKNIEAYITGLMENAGRNATILPLTLHELLILLEENGNALIPRIKLEKEKNDIAVEGVSIIKNYEEKGQFTAVETADVEILRGKLKGGTKVIYKEGHPIDYAIEDIEREIKVSESNGKLFFEFNIDLEGQVKQYYEERVLFDSHKLKELQGDLNTSLGQQCEEIAKLAQEIGIEPFGIREYIEKFKPDLWNSIKDNWEEKYKTASFEVNIDTKIRRIGVVE